MRKLGSWVQGFLEYTEGLESPPRFRRWAGLFTIASALQRRVHTRIKSQLQHPNLYLLFIGRPGGGKSNAIKYAKRIAQNVHSIKLAPQAITKQALFIEFEDAALASIDGQQMRISSAISAFIEEFKTFVEPNDFAFMTTLTDIYDNPPVYDYKTKNVGKSHIERPCFNMLGGIPTRGVKDIFTDEAFEHGFAARIIMIFAGEKVEVEMDLEVEGEDTIEADLEELSPLGAALVHDLEIISKLEGRYKWTKEAANFLLEWEADDLRPFPMDTRLEHYNTRRLAHITKLCMVLAASRRDELRIVLEDAVAAREVLLETEAVMPQALSSIGANPMLLQMARAMKLLFFEYSKSKKPVPEHVLRHHLIKDVPPQYIEQLIEGLILANFMTNVGDERTRVFIPVKNFE